MFKINYNSGYGDSLFTYETPEVSVSGGGI